MLVFALNVSLFSCKSEEPIPAGSLPASQVPVAIVDKVTMGMYLAELEPVVQEHVQYMRERNIDPHYERVTKGSIIQIKYLYIYRGNLKAWPQQLEFIFFEQQLVRLSAGVLMRERSQTRTEMWDLHGRYRELMGRVRVFAPASATHDQVYRFSNLNTTILLTTMDRGQGPHMAVDFVYPENHVISDQFLELRKQALGN